MFPFFKYLMDFTSYCDVKAIEVFYFFLGHFRYYASFKKFVYFIYAIKCIGITLTSH